MLTFLPLPYVQAAGDGGPRTRTQLIVIHATDNTASDTAEASYATHRPDQTSCHVVVDDDSAVQINRLDHVAFGCFPTGNARSIQFELCGLSNQLTPATIARAAQLVAVVAQSWGIPAVRPSLDQMRAGAPGIVGHVDVTNAWHEGDHTDPGASFPWADFLRQVQAAMTNQPSEDDAMTAQEVWDYPLGNADGSNGSAGVYVGMANQYAYHGGQAAWRAEHLARGLAAMADPIEIPGNDRLDIAAESVPNMLARALRAGVGLVQHVHAIAPTQTGIADPAH